MARVSCASSARTSSASSAVTARCRSSVWTSRSTEWACTPLEPDRQVRGRNDSGLPRGPRRKAGDQSPLLHPCLRAGGPPGGLHQNAQECGGNCRDCSPRDSPISLITSPVSVLPILGNRPRSALDHRSPGTAYADQRPKTGRHDPSDRQRCRVAAAQAPVPRSAPRGRRRRTPDACRPATEQPRP